MNYKTKERYNAILFEFKGDILGGPDGNKFIDELHSFKEEGKHNFVVDLGKVRFMNSSGLGMLIRALTTVRNAGGDLRLSRVAKNIESLLVITRLITVFKHYEKTDDAIASFDEDTAE